MSASDNGAGRSDCVFCRIAATEIPADIVASDAEFVAFRDLHPIAPVHLLVVPRRHIASLDDVDGLDVEMRGRMLSFIAAAARDAGAADSGYRVVTNTGPDAGQEVTHLHWHIIGGERLGGMA
jgi:histidine triad (HIT) family protein